MQTTSISLSTIKATVSNAASAAKLTDKQVQSLQGFDSLLREGGKFLILSLKVLNEKAMNKVTKKQYDRHYVYVIDAEKGIKKLNRTALAGGMGYEKPNQIEGKWELNKEGTWYTLQPAVEDEETRKSFKSWGISKILPESFEKVGDTITIPYVMLIEVTKTGYLAGQSPVSKEEATAHPEKLQEVFLKPYSQFYWEGKGSYPTEEEVNQFLTEVKQKFPKQLADIEQYKDMFKTV